MEGGALSASAQANVSCAVAFGGLIASFIGLAGLAVATAPVGGVFVAGAVGGYILSGASVGLAC